jgi:hypothetical protein
MEYAIITPVSSDGIGVVRAPPQKKRQKLATRQCTPIACLGCLMPFAIDPHGCVAEHKEEKYIRPT